MINFALTKQGIKNHFKRFFLVYILGGVLVSLISMWEVDMKTKLKSDEKLGFFFSLINVDTKLFKDDIDELDLEVKEINTFTYDYDDFYFWDNFLANGVANSDLMILNESAIDKSGTYLMECAGVYNNNSVEVYSKKGFKAYDKTTKTGVLAKYLTTELTDNLYFCINKDSAHIGANNEGKTDIINKVLTHFYEEN